MKNNKIGVAVLGATGVVGQKIIAMIEDHELFEVTELVASERSLGKEYGERVSWKEKNPMPQRFKTQKLIGFDDVKSKWVLSALPSDIAKLEELKLANKGKIVVSNASSYRMNEDVPLLVPEINLNHMELVEKQTTSGKIITNPNCSTVFVTLAMAPLMELGKLNHLSVVTAQAISGAGYPGLSCMDVMGNLIPNIGGEEEKIEQETKKILGEINKDLDLQVHCHVNRIPVMHGHTVVLHLHFNEEIDLENVKALYEKWNESKNFGDFKLYKFAQDEFGPQPLRDLSEFDQSVHIGRFKLSTDKKVLGLTAMGHNLVRGAAGAAILNLEQSYKYFESK